MLGFNHFIDNIIHKNFTILTFIDSIFIFRGCIHDCLHKNITMNWRGNSIYQQLKIIHKNDYKQLSKSGI